MKKRKNFWLERELYFSEKQRVQFVGNWCKEGNFWGERTVQIDRFGDGSRRSGAGTGVQAPHFLAGEKMRRLSGVKEPPGLRPGRAAY